MQLSLSDAIRKVTGSGVGSWVELDGERGSTGMAGHYGRDGTQIFISLWDVELSLAWGEAYEASALPSYWLEIRWNGAPIRRYVLEEHFVEDHEIAYVIPYSGDATREHWSVSRLISKLVYGISEDAWLTCAVPHGYEPAVAS